MYYESNFQVDVGSCYDFADCDLFGDCTPTTPSSELRALESSKKDEETEVDSHEHTSIIFIFYFLSFFSIVHSEDGGEDDNDFTEQQTH